MISPRTLIESPWIQTLTLWRPGSTSSTAMLIPGRLPVYSSMEPSETRMGSGLNGFQLQGAKTCTLKRWRPSSYTRSSLPINSGSAQTFATLRFSTILSCSTEGRTSSWWSTSVQSQYRPMQMEKLNHSRIWSVPPLLPLKKISVCSASLIRSWAKILIQTNMLRTSVPPL